MSERFDGHLIIRIGADMVRMVQLLQADGSPLDLSSATLAGSLKPRLESNRVVANLTFNVTDAANGIVELRLTKETTANLRPGSGVWELEYTIGGVTLPAIPAKPGDGPGRYDIRPRAVVSS